MSKPERGMVALKIETKKRHDKLRGDLPQDYFEKRLLDLWEAHNPIERATKIIEFGSRKGEPE